MNEIEIKAAIAEMLQNLPNLTIGEYVKTEDVYDMLLDVLSIVSREKVAV